MKRYERGGQWFHSILLWYEFINLSSFIGCAAHNYQTPISSQLEKTMSKEAGLSWFMSEATHMRLHHLPSFLFDMVILSNPFLS